MAEPPVPCPVRCGPPRRNGSIAGRFFARNEVETKVMMRAIGCVVLAISLIGLLVVTGVLKMIF
ncbi:hypothetical protein [Sphingomonas profundi]|uniref:hypothetical protein n=1 Tax=Alterirhizorhabdus profundi TaxID=2681549 RepID=UPI0012E8C645|nr:hypothetical protein [Sphingomonas profundi]